MSRILQVFYIIFSATILALGIPNEIYHFGSPLMGFLALIPFYLAYRNIKSYKEAFYLSFLHALITHLLSSFWLAFFKEFAALTLGASAIATGFIHGVIGLLYFAPFAKEKTLLKDTTFTDYKNIILKILWFPFVYIVWEWIKSIGFFGYPWGTISSTMFRLKFLTQIADITGTYGITFICALYSAILAEGFLLVYNINKYQNKKQIVFQYKIVTKFLLVLSISSFIYGSYQYFKPRKPIKTLNTILVQQNADPWKQSNDNETIIISQNLTEKKLNEAKVLNEKVDLVVWSEGCLKYPFPYSYEYYKNSPFQRPLIDFIKETNVPYLLGGSYKIDAKNNKYVNAAMLFDKEGNLRGTYGKNHLVPIAEAIPFIDIPVIGKTIKKLIGISAGWTPGNQYTLFEVQGHYPDIKILPESNIISLKQSYEEQLTQEKENPYVTISTPICFDDSFPDVCRPLFKYGSEVYMNITDDSWSQKKSSEYQHFVVSSYRAIESRTTLARSTNSGYSVVINPAGKIIHDMPLFEETSTFVKIPVYKKTKTTYMTYGNWFPKIITIFVLLTLFFTYKNLNVPLNPKSEVKHKNKKKKKKKK